MANQNLGTTPIVTSMLQKNGVLVEIDGSIRRITLDNFMNALNTDDSQLLRQVAWGVPIKQNQSDPEWGVIGNTGMWSEYKQKIGRYLVTNEGKAAKLSASNSSVFADGTPLDESKGHVMVVAPNLYYRVVNDPVTGVDTLWMSMLPIGGHRIGGENADYVVLGAYKSSLQNLAFVSRSGVVPSGYNTITASWERAQNNGKDWGLISWDHARFMMMLCLSEYGCPNVQAHLGYGICGSTNAGLWDGTTSLTTGATIALGDACGKIPISVSSSTATGVDCSRVSLFGIEDPYGWRCEMLQGIYFGNANNEAQDGTEVFIYEGNRLPDEEELKTHPKGNYRQSTRLQAGDGYGVKTMAIGEYFDLLPREFGGGSNAYWCDTVIGGNLTGQLACFGGNTNTGYGAGLAHLEYNRAWGYSYTSFGTRVAYYGSLEFTTGANLMAES